MNDHRNNRRDAINTVQLGRIQEASVRQKAIVTHTPLMENLNLSRRFGARIWLKREDLQVVRSYKIRGAYNKISNLSDEEKRLGIVCASAGNHAQGVAYSCAKLGIPGCIFMPSPTPKQKIRQVEFFADGAKLGEVGPGPLTFGTFTWTNPPLGAHVLHEFAVQGLG